MLETTEKAYQGLAKHLSGGFQMELLRAKRGKKKRNRVLKCLSFMALGAFGTVSNTAIADQNDPTSYEGVQGYGQMVQDVQNSLHHYMPEYSNRILFFNPLGDFDKNVDSIEERLGLSANQFGYFIQDKLTKSEDTTVVGTAKLFEREGETVCVASAWPAYSYDGNEFRMNDDFTLSKDVILDYAARYIHEAFHCLKDLELREDNLQPNLTIGIGFMESNYHVAQMVARARHEHFAMLGAMVMMGLNNAKQDVLASSIAENDHMRPIMSHTILNVAYDSGMLMRQAEPLFENNTGVSSYYFHHWREALAQTQALFDNYEINAETIVDQHIQNTAVRIYVEDLMRQGAQDIEAETIAVLRERQNALPVYRRVVNAFDFINGLQDPLATDIPSLTLEQMMARSLILYNKTANNADFEVARILSYRLKEKHDTGLMYSPIYDSSPDMYGEDVLHFLMDNPDILEKVANGTTLAQIDVMRSIEADSDFAQEFADMARTETHPQRLEKENIAPEQWVPK